MSLISKYQSKFSGLTREMFFRKTKIFLLGHTPLGEIVTKFYDLLLHLKYSFKEKNLKDDKQQIEFYLTKHYHIIEKGLALPEPRVAFGQPKINDLVEKSEEYIKKYGATPLINSIKNMLRDYLKFNLSNNANLPKEFMEKLTNFIKDMENSGTGGVRAIKKADMQTLSIEDFSTFVRNRTSVRDFSAIPVNDDQIIAAVNIAKHAPSVCNRQGWVVHYYSDKALMAEILSHQNGNAGFTNSIDKLIIITGNIKAFTKYESNQLFIDGGLFSMNLMFALHAAGLGACPLNTSYPYFSENMVKEIAKIPKNERLIMMLGIGNLKEEFLVAYSCRNEIENFFRSH